LSLRDNKFDVELKISVILNQLAVTVETAIDWDVFDLRNFIATIIQYDLAIISFITGNAYSFELTRCIHRRSGIDQVFGIDIPAIANRQKAKSSATLAARFSKIKRKAIGNDGILLNRCFSDLASAMKYHNDSPFYCYRAIEALRNHCAAQNGLLDSDDPAQWQKFREVTGLSKEDITRYKDKHADKLRHGKPSDPMTDQERADMFVWTWDIVDKYLDSI